MKLVTPKGRVILEVTYATRGLDGLTRYNYRSDTGLGYGLELAELQYAIECLRMDAPKAKLVGLLPEPAL